MTINSATFNGRQSSTDTVNEDDPSQRDAVLKAARALLTPHQMAEVFERRVVIEQAKGMLMFVYGIGADDAFDILRWQSQEHNIKLYAIAEQMLSDLVQLSQSKGPARDATESVLYSAHRRISEVASRHRRAQT